MVQFLSDDWLRQADAAASALDVGPSLSITVDHHVTGAPGGDRHHHVVIDDGQVRFRSGPSGGGHVEFTLDWPTAVAIAAGLESVRQVVLDGRLRIGGDTPKLIEAGAALDQVDDALAPLRERTTY